MDHKKWYTCAFVSKQVFVLALCFLMKLDRNVRGMMDGGMSVNSVHRSHQFSEPCNWRHYLEVINF